jgi:hypothetical protein
MLIYISKLRFCRSSRLDFDHFEQDLTFFIRITVDCHTQRRAATEIVAQSKERILKEARLIFMHPNNSGGSFIGLPRGRGRLFLPSI